MKIRTDFVTNSSSSSFIALGILDDEICHFIKDILGGRDEAYSDYQVGYLNISDGVICVTTTLDYGSFYVHNHEYDRRSKRQIESDNNNANKANNLLPAIEAFLPLLSFEQKERLKKMLKAAVDRKSTIAEIFIDQTDGFDCRSYDWSDFPPEARNYIPSCFNAKGGKLLSYDESQAESETLFLPRAITSLSEKVFKGCKFKEIIGFASMQEPGIFANCTNLENIEFVGSPYVPREIFQGCISLKKVKLPDKIYGIEKGAFSGCANLESINIPESVEFIEDGAFEGCLVLAKKDPALWQRVCSMPNSKSEFLHEIETDLQYIISHGGASFKPDRYDYFGSIKRAKRNYELWHSIYDSYIEEITSLDHRLKFSFDIDPGFAKELLESFSEEIKELHWRQVQNVSEFTDILAIETDEIYHFDRFEKKQAYLRKGLSYNAEQVGKTQLEKAVEIKNSGGKIKIITLNNLLNLLSKKEFSEASEEKTRRKVEQTAKKESKEAQCEELIASILAKSKEAGVLFSNAEIVAMIEESDVPVRRFDKYISDKYGKTLKEFFEDFGVLKTVKTEFYALVELLKQRYESKPKVADVTALIADNADLDLSIIANNAKRFTGLSTREYLISEGILAGAEVKTAESLTEGVLYKPGEEPEDIKKRIKTLFEKLDGAYPDKVIVGLHKDHKKWGETVTDLYRKLGYKSGADFLTAYGYKMSEDKGGRPKIDYSILIEAIKGRYPNGAEFKTAAEFLEANADLPNLNTFKTDAPNIVGMTFGKWLKSIGLMGK